jgi:hypothetical protein
VVLVVSGASSKHNKKKKKQQQKQQQVEKGRGALSKHNNKNQQQQQQAEKLGRRQAPFTKTTTITKPAADTAMLVRSSRRMLQMVNLESIFWHQGSKNETVHKAFQNLLLAAELQINKTHHEVISFCIKRSLFWKMECTVSLY